MSKILVAYFSASGVTAGTAKNLAEAAGADLYEIKPAVPYTSADLNWQNKQSRSSVEMSNILCSISNSSKNEHLRFENGKKAVKQVYLCNEYVQCR